MVADLQTDFPCQAVRCCPLLAQSNHRDGWLRPGKRWSDPSLSVQKTGRSRWTF